MSTLGEVDDNNKAGLEIEETGTEEPTHFLFSSPSFPSSRPRQPHPLRSIAGVYPISSCNFGTLYLGHLDSPPLVYQPGLIIAPR